MTSVAKATSQAEAQTAFIENALDNLDKVKNILKPGLEKAVADLRDAPRPAENDRTMVLVLNEDDNTISVPTNTTDTGVVTDGLASHVYAALSFDGYIETVRDIIVEYQQYGDIDRFNRRIESCGTTTRSEILGHVLTCYRQVPEIAPRVKSVFAQFEAILTRVTTLAHAIDRIATIAPGTTLLVRG